MNQKGSYPIVICLLGSVILLLLLLKSKLLQDDISILHVDSQVYIHTAQQWMQGKVLYKEIVEHKGPLLYVINIIGLILAGGHLWGIWVIQLIMLMTLLWLIAYYVSRHESWFVSAAAMIFFVVWIYRSSTIGDNIPEMYAVPFVGYIVLLSFRMMVVPTLSIISILLGGLSFAALLLLKLNFVVLAVPFIIWMLNMSFQKKYFLKLILLLTAGFLFLFIPFLLYFLYHDSFWQAMDAIYTLNMEYAGRPLMPRMKALSTLFIRPINYFFLFAFISVFLKFIFTDKNKNAAWAILSSMLLGLIFLVYWPGRGSESVHYLMPLAPIYFFAVIWLLYGVKQVIELLLLALSLWFLRPLAEEYLKEPNRKEYSIASSYPDALQKYKRKGDRLWVVGNKASVYSMSALEPAHKYFYTYPILNYCESDRTQQVISELEEELPPLVFVEKKYDHAICWQTFIANYRLVWEDDSYQIYRYP